MQYKSPVLKSTGLASYLSHFFKVASFPTPVKLRLFGNAFQIRVSTCWTNVTASQYSSESSVVGALRDVKTLHGLISELERLVDIPVISVLSVLHNNLHSALLGLLFCFPIGME